MTSVIYDIRALLWHSFRLLTKDIAYFVYKVLIAEILVLDLGKPFKGFSLLF